MQKLSLLILRVGLAVTFFWIGVLIISEPEAWGAFIKPWALKILPIPIKEVMVGTAYLDMAIGLSFLFKSLTPLAAAAGAIHLTIVLVTSGITEITVRDIGLLAALLALVVHSWPDNLKFWKK